MKPRILLTGCHGRLGQHLLRTLLGEAEVLGLDLAADSFVAHPDFHYGQLEGTSRKALRPWFEDFKPQGVLNAAAWTDVDGAETHKDECWRANVDLVRALADCCRPGHVWMGQVSTDYVFDGTAGPYGPDDQPSPKGVYARSKLAAENLLKGEEFPVAIFRTIVLFGKGHGLKADFLEWATEELSAERPIRVVTDQVGNCCWAMDLARAMQKGLFGFRRGTFHVASRGHVSRHELCRMLAAELGLNADLVQPILSAGLSQAAPRPLQSGLCLEETERALGLRFQPIAETLKAWSQDRPELWLIN